MYDLQDRYFGALRALSVDEETEAHRVITQDEAKAAVDDVISYIDVPGVKVQGIPVKKGTLKRDVPLLMEYIKILTGALKDGSSIGVDLLGERTSVEVIDAVQEICQVVDVNTADLEYDLSFVSYLAKPAVSGGGKV